MQAGEINVPPCFISQFGLNLIGDSDLQSCSLAENESSRMFVNKDSATFLKCNIITAKCFDIRRENKQHLRTSLKVQKLLERKKKVLL